jgi:predicted nucleotidyltransferase
MRLTEKQRKIIASAARQYFGADSRVRLFGSRLRDDLRGGDIDLYVETSCCDPDSLVDAKLHFLAEVHSFPCLEGEKIDVVLSSPLHSEMRGIDRIARAEGMEL